MIPYPPALLLLAHPLQQLQESQVQSAPRPGQGPSSSPFFFPLSYSPSRLSTVSGTLAPPLFSTASVAHCCASAPFSTVWPRIIPARSFLSAFLLARFPLTLSPSRHYVQQATSEKKRSTTQTKRPRTMSNANAGYECLSNHVRATSPLTHIHSAATPEQQVLHARTLHTHCSTARQ